MDKRLRELDALLHAGRIGLGVAIARLAKPHVLEHLVGALHRVAAGQPRELPAVGDERHGVHARNVSVGFGHVPQPGADLQRTRRHVETEHVHAAGRGRDEPQQRLQETALARPVRPQQPYRTGQKGHLHVAQHFVPAIPHGNLVERGDRRGVWTRDCHHCRENT